MPDNSIPEPALAVIFDVDGTMVDNSDYHLKAWIELGRRHNLPIDKKFYMEIIHGRDYNGVAGKYFEPLVGPEKVRTLGDEKEIIYRQMYHSTIKEIPGLTPFLQQLCSAGILCAAASNSPILNVDMILDELNLKRFFKAVIDVTQVSMGKPNPEIFLTAAAKLAIPPARCIVVEDSCSGFEAARRANMPYIVITAGAKPDDIKFAYDAKVIHKDFTAITLSQLQTYVGA